MFGTFRESLVKIRLAIFKACILSSLDYASVIYDSKWYKEDLDQITKLAARMTPKKFDGSAISLITKLKLPDLSTRLV
ncbi:unnamed protein product [Didymodactylos carnosus]|uniref:Uncharacterized protein n=1 Tax=Didymodactylos carnosus TaxID=1234261 RepID=A0A814BI32_9BILA|nr:unnamed protein product [Didymodactylos carnosus]CAF1364605.1 unnamed protein product [Didymodactylos carnosus]CAF3707839.1 unnamed protein product [Didymodactylos carnosus]CAF4174119.1 unnamed protein product [Didymodactylos carnosus]